MLWHKMGLKEACEPSFPPGHELELKASKRSNKRSGEAPTYLAHTSGKISANIPPPPHTQTPQAGFQGGGGGRHNLMAEEGVIYQMLWYITPAATKQGGEN